MSGGPLGLAAICMVALFFVARQYIDARNQKDAVLMQWNTESKALIVDSAEAAAKIADSLVALIPLVTKSAERLVRINDRLARIEEQLHVKRAPSTSEFEDDDS